MGVIERRNATIFVFFALSGSSLEVWSKSEIFPVVLPSTRPERAAERVR